MKTTIAERFIVSQKSSSTAKEEKLHAFTQLQTHIFGRPLVKGDKLKIPAAMWETWRGDTDSASPTPLAIVDTPVAYQRGIPGVVLSIRGGDYYLSKAWLGLVKLLTPTKNFASRKVKAEGDAYLPEAKDKQVSDPYRQYRSPREMASRHKKTIREQMAALHERIKNLEERQAQSPADSWEGIGDLARYAQALTDLNEN